MSYRFMRMLVLFDLPVITSEDRRNYTAFRKFLLRNGFTMLQKSVYCKLLLNSGNADLLEAKIRKSAPDNGLVQLLVITEKQFSRIKYITGEYRSEVVSSTERTIIRVP